MDELAIDFLEGKVLRGEQELMTLEELLFLLHSAKQYNDMFPIAESEAFVGELRERIGTGFTREQMEEHKAMIKEFIGGSADD
ncbi:hypothetical protein IAQ67_28870 (plasmid) [Paenibacillus peoriae]|uniref:Uncharacterized protein n=1 Tax=Paenibacillus peoriae TaxID=59893 RepID=A0A7H0YH13_9BACL|nr:hypothetical protein [Paenibacillus peoriae]QNR70371.1 hypothetical protein IAQ67_28870 [Paenibacillus peoriae]